MNESIENAIREKILSHVRDLLDTHWRAIVEIREQEKGEVTIGFHAHIQAIGPRPIVKTKIRYARTFTDEAEEMLPDTAQEEMKL